MTHTFIKNCLKATSYLCFYILLLTQFTISYAASSAPSNEQSLGHSPIDLPDIIKRGYLKVAMLKTDENPFFYHNAEGKFVGVDVELLEIMEKELGIDIQILRIPSTFDGVVDMVANGEADLGMSYLSITLKRAKRVNYTIPYALNYFAVALNRVSEARSKTKGNTADFLNKPSTRLGLQMGSAYEVFAKRLFPNAQLVSIPDSTENLMAVDRGEIDATVSAKLTLEPLLKINPKLNFQLRTVVFRDEPDLMAGVVHPENTHLLHWVNTFLSLQQTLGTLDQIKIRNGIKLEKTEK